MRHVVAYEADDEGVPQGSGGARDGFEQLSGEVRLALLAEFTEAGTDGRGLEGWRGNGGGRRSSCVWRQRERREGGGRRHSGLHG